MLLISINHLSFSYDKNSSGVPILKDLTLSVAPGEIIILTGPSGSGKSTLLTIIGALRTATHGSVVVLGKELRIESGYDKIRQAIGFIFQHHHLLPFLSALENVMLPLELELSLSAKIRQQLALDTLISLGLEDHVNVYPSELSGGQKQRVAVARALARKPKLILADEPTAALDQAAAERVMEAFKEQALQQKASIIIITHDYRLFQYAHRLLRLENGKLESK